MENEIIYFLMLDRFNQGEDKKEIKDIDKNHPRRFHGGDLQGLIDKLPYIKDLGFTTVWLTPIYKNETNGYHGYWAEDFYSVDPHFGDLDKFIELVNRAHHLGIKILLDIVVNHTGKTHPFFVDNEKRHWYHPHEPIINIDDQREVEDKCLAMLPDLNQDIPEVERYLIDMCKWWISETGLDGFRIDTVKHVPRRFWKKFCKELKELKEDIILIGEVWHPDPAYLAVYQEDGINSLVDFPLYEAIVDIFAQDKPMDKISTVLAQDHLYKNPNILGTFIDNHDVPRFISETHDKGEERLKLALAFLLSFRGVPIIYYGTEIAMEGGNDPDNRKDMDFGANPKFTEYVKGLIKLRKENLALNQGQVKILKVDHDTILFLRQHGDEKIVVAINNSTDNKEIALRVPKSIRGENWQVIWGQGTHKYDYGIVTCGVPKKSAVLYRVM